MKNFLLSQIFLAITASLLAGSASFVAAAQPWHEDIEAHPVHSTNTAISAAEQSLSAWIEALRADPAMLVQANVFNVTSMDQAASLRIGSSIPLMLLDEKALIGGKALSASLTPTNHQRFVVFSGSEPVGLITVAESSPGEFSTTSLGASELASTIQDALSGEQTQSIRLVRSIGLHSAFLQLDGDNGSEPRYRRLDASQAKSAPRAVGNLEFEQELRSNLANSIQ